MKKLWFKNKIYGWGWTPASWEGWTVTAIWLAFVVYALKDVDSASQSGSGAAIGIVAPVVVSIALLVAICWKTGERPE